MSGFDSALLLAVLYVAMVANLISPHVRFQLPFVNYAVFAAAQLIPIGILKAATREAGWRRVMTAIIGLVLLVPATPFGLGAAACVALSVPADASFERQQVLSAAAGTVAVYRTDGGATTAFGIVVRQECTIVPGLLLVRLLTAAYPADEARLEQEPSGRVRVVIPKSQERTKDFNQLMPLRYFCWGPQR